MRKALLFVVGLIFVGIAAYYGGYYLYQSSRPEVKIEEQQIVGRGINQKSESKQENYYLLKIEENQLVIYKMPKMEVYDCMKIQGLQFQEKDKPILQEGMAFFDLTEVFEFLESCMS